MDTLKDFINNHLLNAKRLVIFTGAGISTDSGLPDYRSPNGVWQRYKPVYFQDFLTEHEARVRYWTMKKELYATYKDVRPNQNHHIIAQLNQTHPIQGLITQNIDGFHQQSGLDPNKLIELHGTDRQVSCLQCDYNKPAKEIFETLDNPISPPKCPSCSGWLKPATISFGQSLNPNHLDNAQEWAINADLFLVIGSSLVVHPAAALPLLARDNGAYLAIINRDPTPLDNDAHYVLNNDIQCFTDELASNLNN